MYLILGLAFVVIIVFFYKSRFKNVNVKQVPGPPPLPFFGNVFDFFTSTTKFLSKAMEYIETYGPVVRLGLCLSKSTVLLVDYHLTEQILRSTKTLDKNFMYAPFADWFGTGLLTSTGVKWKSHRKMITPSFHFSILKQFMRVFNSVGDQFIEKIDEVATETSVDIFPMVSLCTLDIICEAAMGISVNALKHGDSEYVKSVKTMCRIVADRTFSIFHDRLYFLTPDYYRQRRALKVLHSHTNEIIDRRIESMANKNLSYDEVGAQEKVAFLDLVLKSTIDGKPLTRTEVREEVDIFMFGGHDTIASAITFALYSLAMHREIQKKVFEEQVTIFGHNRASPVKDSDLQDMKYLELVIKETLRLYPPVPAIGRTLCEDLEWDGVVLPTGDQVILFIYAIQRNPKYFPNPLEFIPERFENYDGKKPFSYIPFSAGPRNCIGQKFAMMEMKTLLSKVVRNFELYPSEPRHELQLAPETILVSKNGVRISVTRRK